MDRDIRHKHVPFGPALGQFAAKIGAKAQKSTPRTYPRLLRAKEIVSTRNRSGFGLRLENARFDLRPVIINKPVIDLGADTLSKACKNSVCNIDELKVPAVRNIVKFEKTRFVRNNLLSDTLTPPIKFFAWPFFAQQELSCYAARPRACWEDVRFFYVQIFTFSPKNCGSVLYNAFFKTVINTYISHDGTRPPSPTMARTLTASELGALRSNVLVD